jgi:hypothetical protein
MTPFRCVLFATVFSVVWTSHAFAQHDAFFANYCVKCHGPVEAEGDLRLDNLARQPISEGATETWTTIVEMIEAGDMPPVDQPQPKPEEAKRVVAWIGDELARASESPPALRRMNRYEYENTVRDLLGVTTDLADMLPEDSSVQGFDNVAGGLGISSILMERYLAAANAAFDDVIRRIKPLPPETRRCVLMEQKDNISSVKGNKGGVIESHGAYVDFSPGWPPARIDEAHPIEDGVYRCRIAVWPHNPNDHRTLAVGIYVGPLFGQGKRRFVGIFDVTGTPGDPRIIEFTIPLKASHSLHILPWIYPQHVTWRDKEEPRPGVAIKWVETHGPLDQEFPSYAQQKLFGCSGTLEMEEGDSVHLRHRRGVKSHFVASASPKEDVERIVGDFATRAFRRPVDEQVVRQFIDLAQARLEQGSTFEQAVRTGVTAVLCSPHFLLINKSPSVDDYAIAERLSYFLWSSMPDDELLRLAAAGKLSDTNVRREQVARMLKGPKIERLVDNFTGQWLDLREIEETTPDKKLYPEFDDLLLRSMVAETKMFFRHILDEDLSATNFVDSDFAFLNQRLATHYGIDGVRGHEQLRKVTLPADCVRGGVLTHASVLKVTANGTNTSPVLRGVWVLDNILGQPAPPPPPGVPAVEPDIRGATTIREQLDLHRENTSCARCHVRIDPPGFAMEEFDVIGGHRAWYRSIGNTGERVPKVNYRVGPTVENGGQLSDNRAFSDFVEFRNLLASDPDVMARTLVKKLLVYGRGRRLTPVDSKAVEAIVGASRENGHGLKSLIFAIVDSELFRQP